MIALNVKGADGKLYHVTNETWYHVETSTEIIDLLENIRLDGKRIRLYLGDTKTGKDWQETFDVTGTIGRSTGQIKVPLLIHNSRSHGGGAILTHCIIKIETSKGKRVLYQHPLYHS